MAGYEPSSARNCLQVRGDGVGRERSSVQPPDQRRRRLPLDINLSPSIRPLRSFLPGTERPQILGFGRANRSPNRRRRLQGVATQVPPRTRLRQTPSGRGHIARRCGHARSCTVARARARTALCRRARRVLLARAKAELLAACGRSEHNSIPLAVFRAARRVERALTASAQTRTIRRCAACSRARTPA